MQSSLSCLKDAIVETVSHDKAGIAVVSTIGGASGGLYTRLIDCQELTGAVVLVVGGAALILTAAERITHNYKQAKAMAPYFG